MMGFDPPPSNEPPGNEPPSNEPPGNEPPGNDRGDDKANRFDGASVPRAHTDAAASSTALFEVRDVSIEALLRQVDAALEAIRSLDDELPDEEVG